MSIIKEEKPIFSKVMVVLGAIFLVNIFSFFYKYGNFNKGFTGFSIAETLTKVLDIPLSSKIFLLVQWAALIFLLFFTIIKDKGMKSRKNELSGIDLKKVSKTSGTDLDALYKILQEKKELRISTISKLFHVDKDIATEWCKILESSNLVEIDYPRMSEPVVKIAA